MSRHNRAQAVATGLANMNTAKQKRIEDRARLNAAAPDLLDALEEMVKAVQDDDESAWPELIVARAAIAKAKGEA